MRKSVKQKYQWNADRARAELALWRSSGETMEAFSGKRGYPANRLSWWKRQLRLTGQWTEQQEGKASAGSEKARAASILEATVTGAASRAGAIVEMGFGVRIEVADTATVDPRWVAAVAAHLSRGG
jgi:hypothetical protein